MNYLTLPIGARPELVNAIVEIPLSLIFIHLAQGETDMRQHMAA